VTFYYAAYVSVLYVHSKQHIVNSYKVIENSVEYNSNIIPNVISNHI